MLPFHLIHGHAPVPHFRGCDKWHQCHRFRDHLCHRAESRKSRFLHRNQGSRTAHFLAITARKDAENQVRSRFGQLAHLVRVPKLYGVSAIGRQLSYYTYERASGIVKPIALTDSGISVVDTAPIERWNTNIMEEGHAKFLVVVEEMVVAV